MRQRRWSSKPATSSAPIEALASAMMQQSAWFTGDRVADCPTPAKAAVEFGAIFAAPHRRGHSCA